MTEKCFYISGQRLLTPYWRNHFSSTSWNGKDLLQTPDKALIPVIRRRKRQRYCGQRFGCLVRIRRREGDLPLPSVLLANVQSIDNKIDKLWSCISYKRDITNCNILRFTELWLNNDMNNIQLAGLKLFQQDSTAASAKTRGGGLCVFVNNSWCTKSKEVSRFCISW